LQYNEEKRQMDELGLKASNAELVKISIKDGGAPSEAALAGSTCQLFITSQRRT